MIDADPANQVRVLSMPSPKLASTATSPVVNDYLDRTTQALEVMARNIDALGQSMIRLNQSVAQQWEVIEAQNDAIARTTGEAPTSRSSTATRIRELSQMRQLPFHLSDASTEVIPPTPNGVRTQRPDLYGDISDDEGEEDGDSRKHLNNETMDDSSLAGEEKQKTRLTVPALLSKYYKANIFDRLKDLVTKGGVTLQDCIASGSLESGHLEIFAGDYESYQLFAPLFEPVIRTCHPLYKELRQQPTDLNYRHLDGIVDLDPMGEYVKKARLVVSRNVAGYNLTPKMSVTQLRTVERLVCEVLDTFTGRMKGSYTPMRVLMQDRALQEQLEQAELPQTYRLTESAGMLSAWPEGRGIFLNADKSLCIFVNVEDHITVVCTEDKMGGAQKAKGAFKMACKALKALSKAINFEFDERLGYITPSPAKLGTALAFSLMLTLPNEGLENEAEQQYQVCIERDPGSQNCIVYNRLSLGVSEVDAICQVVACANQIITQV